MLKEGALILWRSGWDLIHGPGFKYQLHADNPQSSISRPTSPLTPGTDNPGAKSNRHFKPNLFKLNSFLPTPPPLTPNSLTHSLNHLNKWPI